MRIIISIAAAGLLTLAGCGSGGKADGNGAAKADDAAPAASGGKIEIEPGEWETTVETVKVEAPNMPAGAAAMMQGMMGEKKTSRECITPEEAKADADFFTEDKDSNCTREGFAVGGGRIKGSMTCTAEGGKSTISMEGRYSGTSYDMNSKISTEGQGQSMTIEARTTGRRIGDCPPGAEG
jgi:hypothetical protein